MATTITNECINCGACEPECPNTAIYAGGAPWELNGATSPAIAQDIYYIVPSKCTECVGFFDHEACAAVCPVDCCIPDPANVEVEGVLLARARKLHPDETFADDAPSRFRKPAAAPAPPAPAPADAAAAAPAPAEPPKPAAAAPVAAEAPAPKPAPAAAPPVAPAPAAEPAKPAAVAPAAAAPAAAAPAAVAPKPAPAPAAKPAAAKPAVAPAAAAPAPAAPAAAPEAAAGLAMMRLPKDVGALPGPMGEKHFPGELEADFNAVLASVSASPVRVAPAPVQIVFRLAEPILGAMPVGVKARLEAAVGSSGGFSTVRATALNLILNLILYPAVLTAFAVVALGDGLFSQSTGGWIMLGVLIASAEGAWRLREGVIHAKRADELTYRGCLYGLGLAPIGSILARALGAGRRTERKVAFDGFEGGMHEDKTERDRRYGTVYTVAEYANAYLVRLEMPRKLPPSSLKGLWNLPDEMPDYDYNIVLGDNVLAVNASVRGETIRRLSYVSSAFPADFATRIEFGKPVGAFKHRMRDKVLEVVVLKAEAAQFQRAA
jgi:ferredoxin